MDNETVFDQPSSLVELLAIGEEEARDLEIRLQHLSSSDPVINLNLVQEIRSIFAKAISMAKLSNGGQIHQACDVAVAVPADSPYSITDSPCSETSELAFKDTERKEMCKKRKTQPQWTNQVRLVAGPRAEGPMDDGYSWRKYGQKAILGAKYPRGYYRCTHRNTQNCLAMKQVQRCDTNPSVFDVTYRGEHTCSQKNKTSRQPPTPLSCTAVEQPNQPTTYLQTNQSQQLLVQYQHDQELLQSYKTNLKVKTEGLDSDGSSMSFSFKWTPVSCPDAPEQGIFSAPPTLENQFIDSFSSPTFISPTTSESNFFSQCRISNYGCGPASLHASESEVISALTSATNSPVVDRDFIEFAHFDDSDFSRFFEMPNMVGK